jgi:predicted dehydrogenase
VYFDAQATGGRRKTILTAIAAGKHVYTEKPIAKSVEEGRELAQMADSAGIVKGVVHDKLFLPHPLQ